MTSNQRLTILLRQCLDFVCVFLSILSVTFVVRADELLLNCYGVPDDRSKFSVVRFQAKASGTSRCTGARYSPSLQGLRKPTETRRVTTHSTIQTMSTADAVEQSTLLPETYFVPPDEELVSTLTTLVIFEPWWTLVGRKIEFNISIHTNGFGYRWYLKTNRAARFDACLNARNDAISRAINQCRAAIAHQTTQTCATNGGSFSTIVDCNSITDTQPSALDICEELP